MPVFWSPEEEAALREGVSLHGEDWEKIKTRFDVLSARSIGGLLLKWRLMTKKRRTRCFDVVVRVLHLSWLHSFDTCVATQALPVASQTLYLWKPIPKSSTKSNILRREMPCKTCRPLCQIVVP